jgi:hypothetical protein
VLTAYESSWTRRERAIWFLEGLARAFREGECKVRSGRCRDKQELMTSGSTFDPGSSLIIVEFTTFVDMCGRRLTSRPATRRHQSCTIKNSAAQISGSLTNRRSARSGPPNTNPLQAHLKTAFHTITSMLTCTYAYWSRCLAKIL